MAQSALDAAIMLVAGHDERAAAALYARHALEAGGGWTTDAEGVRTTLRAFAWLEAWERYRAQATATS